MQKPRPVPQPEVVARLRSAVERLLAAGQTFAEIPIDALVEEGALAKSTFYVYFDDKDELLRVLARQVIEDLVAFDGAWWVLPTDADKAQTGAALVAMSDAYLEHAALMSAIVEASLYDPLMREQFDALMNGAIEATARHLLDGQREGAVPAHLDAERTARWLTWMLERGFSLLLTNAEDPRNAPRLRAMTDIVWSTYRGGPARCHR